MALQFSIDVITGVSLAGHVNNFFLLSSFPLELNVEIHAIYRVPKLDCSYSVIIRHEPIKSCIVHKPVVFFHWLC